jgi:alpha-ketoglutarate-dependent 2,4-dichlorophenoxyacetate dioxygenase
MNASAAYAELTVTPILPAFGARLEDVPPDRLLEPVVFAEIRRAFERFAVIVLPGQPMDDARQIAFSECFGPLEVTISPNPAGGSAFARQSNIDLRSGELIAPGDRRMDYQKGNMRWHADSTFKAIPSLCSVLSAREVPPVGGATEFASTAAAYAALPPARQAALAELQVEHDLIYSRRRVGFEFEPSQAQELPPARHPLVQVNPVTGTKAVLIGAHAARIVGWPDDESRALLDELLELATHAEHRFAHHWAEGDVVVWDNRAALHRATPFDARRHRRLMQRTTVSYPEGATSAV